MPPPPKKKAMPVAPKTPPKKPAEKPKTPAKEVAKTTSASEAPKSETAKAPAPVPKAIGIEPPKTPPKTAPKTPSEAFRSVSPTLVDAATPAEPKPSGVERTKDPSPMKHPEGLPEQTVEESVSPKVSPKPPPPPLDSPPTAHQEPPPPPTEIGFPVTGPAEVPKSPMVAPVLPKSSPARPLIDWSTSFSGIADRFDQRYHKDHGIRISTHFDTNGPNWKFSGQFRDIQTSSMLHRMPWYWSVDS